MPIISLQRDYTIAAWRIADAFLELKLSRRKDLVTQITKEMEYTAEKASRDTIAQIEAAEKDIPEKAATLLIEIANSNPNHFETPADHANWCLEKARSLPLQPKGT